jgi:hypothetical protein
MVQWAWSYLTFQRGARLITEESRVSPVTTMEYVERARTSMNAAVSEQAEAISQPISKRTA